MWGSSLERSCAIRTDFRGGSRGYLGPHDHFAHAPHPPLSLLALLAAVGLSATAPTLSAAQGGGEDEADIRETFVVGPPSDMPEGIDYDGKTPLFGL